MLAQGVHEGVEVDGVDCTGGAVHGVFYYLDYFAEVEDCIACELCGGEEFEDSWWELVRRLKRGRG